MDIKVLKYLIAIGVLIDILVASFMIISEMFYLKMMFYTSIAIYMIRSLLFAFIYQTLSKSDILHLLKGYAFYSTEL